MENQYTPFYDPNIIRKARLRKFKTVTAFANQLGITRNTAYCLENGKAGISISLVKKACAELGLTMQILIYPND